MLNTKYKLTIFNTYLDQRLICRKYKQCPCNDVYYFNNLQNYWLFLIFSIISRSVISLSQGLSNARLESWAWGTSTLIWRDWDPKTTSGSATQQPVIWQAKMSSSRSSLKVNTSHLLSFSLNYFWSWTLSIWLLSKWKGFYLNNKFLVYIHISLYIFVKVKLIVDFRHRFHSFWL